MTNQEKLIQAYVQALEIHQEKVVDELTYNQIPEWDSTAHLILISELEGTFNVMLEMDEIIDMSSVGKCKEILANHGVEFG